MIGGPVLAGALQLTFSLSVIPSTSLTSGARGAAGGSSTSVRVMVTAMVAVLVGVWVPSVARTVTE